MVRRLFLAVTMVLAAMVVSCGVGVREGAADLPPRYRGFPSFIEEEPFDAATLALTVNHYVDLGEAVAFADLRRRADLEEKGGSSRRGIRIGHVARILWGSSGVALRDRAVGSYADLPFLSMMPTEWPYFPMVRSGDSFFVMSEFRILAGREEPLASYLDYCRREGRFRHHRIPVPTHDQAKRDLDALQASARWRALRWNEDVDHTKYQIPPEWVVDTMKGQIPPVDVGN